MTSKEQRLELESHVCDLEKKVAENETVLGQKEIALKYAKEDLNEKRQRVALHETNWKFMRHNASLVDIKEYRGVEKLLAQARAEYEDVALKVRGLFSAVRAYKAGIEAAEREISRCKDVLASYGRVIRWRAA